MMHQSRNLKQKRNLSIKLFRALSSAHRLTISFEPVPSPVATVSMTLTLFYQPYTKQYVTTTKRVHSKEISLLWILATSTNTLLLTLTLILTHTNTITTNIITTTHFSKQWSDEHKEHIIQKQQHHEHRQWLYKVSHYILP